VNKRSILLFYCFLTTLTPALSQRPLAIGDTLATGTLYNELTEGVAYRLKFWTLYREMRRLAFYQLDKLLAATSNKIADLYFENNDHQARIVSQALSGYIDELSRRFDNIFDVINSRMIFQANQLDRHSATIKEKEEFVNKAKIDLKSNVMALINESSVVIAQVNA